MEATQLLKRKESLALLEQLPSPSHVWKYFLLCTETPRPSHKLDGFRGRMAELAKLLECDHEVDAAGNVRLRRKASEGHENAPGVCFQAHMDMVTSANSDVKIDFAKDPIEVFLTEKKGETWMQARGTTLGADNGLGVAAALAVFEDAKNKKFVHGPLEALFTADEETTMGGAENLAGSPFVQSEILLNVDSEEEYSICIGCAGGAENQFTLSDLTRLSKEEATGYASRQITLSGLLGGHSGIEIHTGRANSLKCLNKLIRMVDRNVGGVVRLVSFVGTGAPNVIPREASATIAVPTASVEAVEAALAAEFVRMQASYLSVEHRAKDNKRESVMALHVGQAEGQNEPPLDERSTRCVLDAVELFHSGVIRMSYDVEGLVETSINLSSVEAVGNELKMYSFARSSSSYALPTVQDSLEAYGRLVGANVSAPINPFPGWDPDIESLALTEMNHAHKEVMDRDARVYAVHAGLECGLIQAVYPEISCISVGPEIHHAHSPDECVLVPSVKRFYDLVIRFLERIAAHKDFRSQ